jgi:hypothetical protein
VTFEPRLRDWSTIETAPSNEDVMLMVSDGNGQPYILKSLWRLTTVGWAHSEMGTLLRVKPVMWRRRSGARRPGSN